MAAAAAVRQYKKAMAPLDETARARLRVGVAGKLPSPEGEADLADLVNSFYDEDDDDGVRPPEEEQSLSSTGNKVEDGEGGGTWWRYKLEAVLAELKADAVAESVRVALKAVVLVAGAGGAALEVSKGKLAFWLLETGFDVGQRVDWLKGVGDWFKAGAHDFVDVVFSVGGGHSHRYIVEVNIAAEFEIARPSDDYAALLLELPVVFVGRPEALRSVVLLMCDAAAESMKAAGLFVSPWRRSAYVLGKWLRPYKRIAPSAASRAKLHCC